MNSISNIDTIYFLVFFENYCDNENLLSTLKSEKEKALSIATDNASYKHMITLNEMAFQLLPTGSRGYAYIIKNNGYEIKIAQYLSKMKNFAPVQVRISSEYLWAYGLRNSYSFIFNWLTETLGNIKEIKISRVDLAMHISNPDFITNYENCYKGKFKKASTLTTNKDINCLTFGSRSSPVYCRIYNKSLEITEQKHKYWFHDIWQKNNMNIHNVWNVEFEVKSEFLRDFNILTINDLLEHLSSLWEYFTSKWLVKVDRIHSRIERCPTCELWEYIQKRLQRLFFKRINKKRKTNFNGCSKIYSPYYWLYYLLCSLY